MSDDVDFFGDFGGGPWGITIVKFDNLSKSSILKIKNWFLEVDKNHPTVKELETILKNDTRKDYWNKTHILSSFEFLDENNNKIYCSYYLSSPYCEDGIFLGFSILKNGESISHDFDGTYPDAILDCLDIWYKNTKL